MNNSEKRQLLARYVKGQEDLNWQQNVLPNLVHGGYNSDRPGDFMEILADPKYEIFSSALEVNTTEGNQNFTQVFNQLLQTYQFNTPGQLNHPIAQTTLNKILTTETTAAPKAPSKKRRQDNDDQQQDHHDQQQDHDESNGIKSFSLFKKYISEDNNLELFKYLIAMVDQREKSRSEIVKNLVDSLCDQRSFNKSSDVNGIPNSLKALIDIIQTHSGDADDLKKNFQKLLGVKKDGSYLSAINVFFPKEIIESLPQEDGFTKMKELLDLSGIKDDKQQSEYIKDLVKNYCFKNKADNDPEKFIKSEYYLNEACKNNMAEISEVKDDKVRLLYDENIYENSLAFTNPLGPKEIKNLIIHFGSVEKVKKILEIRKNEEDFIIPDAIRGGRLGGAADDYEFLREVLQKGNKNLLTELIGGSMPLIDQDQIFRSLEFKASGQHKFEPIVEAFNKNQDLAALNCLSLLFSKLSDYQTDNILNSLIPQTQQDNFLTGLLSRNYDSAKMLIDLANKADFQDNIKSSLSHIIANKNIVNIENGNYIALLNMFTDNGPLSFNFMEGEGLEQTSRELRGAEIFAEILSRDQFYNRQESPSILLNQNNPAALALFFEKTGGVETDANRHMIDRLCGYLEDPHNQTNKNSDACQNSLMFLLTKNTNPQLEENFVRFLTVNDKKDDDKKLIKTIYDSIFAENDGQSLASDFQTLNMNPLLEAGKIFEHLDDKNSRNEKNKMGVAFGKDGIFKMINKEKAKKELAPESYESIGLKLVGYKISENNPLLANDASTKDLTSRLNDRLNDGLMKNGFRPIRKVAAPENAPATAVGATEGNAVSQTTTTQSPTPS